MSLLFLLLLGLYVVQAVLLNRRDEPPDSRLAKIFGAFLHTGLFAIACYFAARAGAFSRQLVSPGHIGAGLVAGHLIFGVSLLVTHRSCRVAAEQFVDLGSLWAYMVESPMVLLRFLSVSIGEELIYRAAAQPLLIGLTGSRAAGILIVAAAFCVVHRHFFKNPMEQSAEFAGFAILLGVLYYGTGSLILVLVIHAVRNIEIAYLEEVIKAQESDGDATSSDGGKGACADAAPEQI